MKKQNTVNAVNKTEKVWFITGSSSGFGRIWTEAALQCGDKVATTALRLESITKLKEKYSDNVLILTLDFIWHDQVKSTYSYHLRVSLFLCFSSSINFTTASKSSAKKFDIFPVGFQ